MGGKRSKSSSLPKNCKPAKRKKRGNSTPPKKSKNASSIFPETLGFPLQSPVDPKRYKIIRLKNGLTAILISACSFHSKDLEKVKMDANCSDVRVKNFNKLILQMNGGRCVKCKGDIGCCDPNTNCKRNSKSCPTKKRTCANNRASNKGSVSLSVGAGAFNDPDECLGLAHLCEHMVLLGSKKYPTPGDFDRFLTSNGGQSNGTTGGDITTFFFEVDYDEKVFTTALDMFSNILISPVIRMNQLKKELQIVENEFQEKRNDDYERRVQILQQSGKKGHPICRFSWGNLSTLKTPDGKNGTLFRMIREFIGKNYSSEHMTLAVEVPEPLSTIEKWVTKYFTAIRNKGIPKLSLANRPLPYDTNEFRKFYYVVSTQETDHLYITWELPAEAWKNYKSKPLEYISRALKAKSPGSLGCCLQDRSLISDLDAKVGLSIHEKTECSVLFHVQFQLTILGMQDVPKILEYTFAYIKFLLECGIQKYFFMELQAMQALDFHYSEELIPSDLEQALRNFPTQDVIIGNHLPITWDPVCIRKYLKMLIPSRANYMVMSKSFDSCKRLEPHFKTRFSVEEIAPDLLSKLENTDNYPCFQPFLENKFIPTNFCKVRDKDEQEHPNLIFQDSKLEFWHFASPGEGPWAHFFLSFLSPIGSECLRHSLMLDIFVRILTNSVERFLYHAVEAKTEYSIEATPQGITIYVAAYSQKIDQIMDIILDHLFHKNIFECLNNFGSAKAGVVLTYYNECVKPESLERNLHLKVCTDDFWTAQEKYNESSEIRFDHFKKFADTYKSEFKIVGYIHGNICSETGNKIALKVLAKCTCDEIEEGTNMAPRALANKLPLGGRILRVRNMNTTCNTSLISNYYQVGPEDPMSPILCDFFVDAMQESAFQTLREVEKLGYTVNVEMTRNYSSFGITISVQTQSDKFSGNHIMKRIDSFVLKYYRKEVQHMTQKKFQSAADAVGVPATDNPRLNWEEIFTQYYDFTKGDLQEIVMGKVDVKEIKKWYEKYLLPTGCCEVNNPKGSSERRMLCIQVVGSADKEFPIVYKPKKNTKDQRSGSDRETHSRQENPKKLSALELIILLPRDSRIRQKCIGDIEEFKRTLYSYPERISAKLSI